MADREPLDRGFFAASVAYGHDPERTHAALEAAGAQAFRLLMREAATDPEPADALLLLRIHRLWFGDAFPDVAGTYTREVVLSRRPRISEPHAIPNDVAATFIGFEEDWVAHGGDVRHRRMRTNGEFHAVVAQANRLAVMLHHVHPFLDGNTRACMTLRAYLLVRAGLPVVSGRVAEERMRVAWNAATPTDHAALDHVLCDQLAEMLGHC